MRNYLKAIFKTNSFESFSLSERKQIKLLNRINLITASLLIVVGIFLFIIAVPKAKFFLLSVNLTLSIILLFSIFLNHINQTKFARFITLISFSVIILITGCSFGENSKVEYLFLFTATMSLVFFSKKKIIFGFWILNLFLLIFVIWYNSEFTPILEREDPPYIIKFMNPVLVFILLAATVQIFKKENLKNESELQKRNEIIKTQSDQLKQLDELKSKLYTNISHEFKTPLTLISAPIQDLYDAEENPKTKKTYKLILINCDRLLNLINQILNLSKLDSGKIKLNNEDFDIIQLLKSTASAYEYNAENQKIKLILKNSCKELRVNADKEYLQVIISNLLSNAFKFTSEGGTIILKTDTYENEIFEFSVANTGKGIPKNKQSKIFDRFYNIQNSNAGKIKGFGIGLELTKGLVELHDGSISVQSELGKGSCFTIKLPVISKDREILLKKEKTHKKDLRTRKLFADEYSEKHSDERIINQPDRKLILIAEDNTDMLKYIKGLLSSKYDITEAENGKAAFNKALETLPDVIISDVMMPETDGIEFCKKIRNEQKTMHIPIVLLTAKNFAEDRIEGLNSGADHYIGKPFNPNELQIVINNLIKRQNQLKEYYSNKIFFSSEPIDNKSEDEKFLNKLIKTIEKNIENAEFNIEDLSKEVSYSRSQLYRKTKALTNTSPNEFIRNIRLKRAAELLKNKAGNISEICYSVGFKKPSYFSECFKNRYNCTPSEYISK